MSPRPRTFSRHLVVLAAGAALFLVCGSQADAQDAKADPAAKGAPAKPALKSLTVYVDTETLLLSLEPGKGKTALEFSGDMLIALDTANEDLVPVTKDGVTEIDFKGRFNGVWVAVVDSKGVAKSFCITGLSGEVYEAAQTVLRANAAAVNQ